MKSLQRTLCALAIVGLAGCVAGEPVGNSSGNLLDEVPEAPLCEPLSTAPVVNSADESDVLGAFGFTTEGDELVLSSEAIDGWLFTRFEIWIGQIGNFVVYPSTYNPATATLEVRIAMSEVPGAECGGEVKVRTYGEVERNGETKTVSVLGAGPWSPGTTLGWYDYYDVCCTPDEPEEPSGCTLTQGYWKNHEEAWPVDSLTIGGVSYTKTELLALLRTPTRGDASLILGHQLIAALLNSAAGASDVDAFADAQAWMTANKDADGRLPYGIPADSATGGAGSGLGDALASYNEGTSGPGHCDD